MKFLQLNRMVGCNFLLQFAILVTVQLGSDAQLWPPECQGALGMENGAITDGQISASSEKDVHHAIQGRLRFRATNDTAGSWSAATDDSYQWLQIDLGNQYTKVTGVATQGGHGINQWAEWVTRYQLQYSDDGENFQDYTGKDRQVHTFTGNNIVVYHRLNHPIKARYIRFQPIVWHKHISMRVEVFGCKGCQGALGMENHTITDGQISASSQVSADYSAIYGRLHINGSWLAARNDVYPWLQVDLGNHTKVTGVATQGRSINVIDWVIKYQLQFSDDGCNFQNYTDEGKKVHVFHGNTDENTVVCRPLNKTIRARYIRFRPTAWYQHISMRVEVYGYKENLTSSEVTLMESRPVCTQLETTTRTEPKSTTTLGLTPLTPTTETAATTTKSNAGLFTPTLSSTIIANTVLTSRTPQTTATTRIKKTSTVTITSSITDTSSNQHDAEKKLLRYTSVISALNVSNKDSLQNAANATNHFFKDLKKDRSEKNEINILVATQELESFAIHYGKTHYKANERKVISYDLFEMKIQKVSGNNKEAVTFSVDETDYSVGESRASISMPSAIFKGQDVVVVSIIYNDIKQWIPDDEPVKLVGAGTLMNLELGSLIIATTVDPRPTGILQENVTISFSYDKEVKEKDIPHCVFWDFTVKSKLNGSWSSIGCSLVKRDNKEITCTCNHLTNFAVLMQVGGKEVPPDHKVALDVITYVGCALSLVGELLTIIAYCVLMDLKQEQIQIRFNLVVAIAIAQIVFLGGIDASETKGVCVFVAALIHYFYLAGFAWMLFEGVYLYLMVVKVFNTVVRMRLFYAVAWGISLLIVVLSIVIASSQDGGVHSYVHGDFCWVSFTNNLIWTFVTPVLVVCLINSVILSLVVHEILKMQGDKASELERMRQGTKACVVLFPLLGMTWVFGVLSVTDAGLAFQYIFTILNSLQGLFIFILHVLRNGDVRAAYSRRRQQWKQAKSVGTSNTSHHDSIDMWANKEASETEDTRSKSNKATPRSSVGYHDSFDMWANKEASETEDTRSKSNKATPRSSVGYGSEVTIQQDKCITPVDM